MLPGPKLDGASVCELIEQEGVTIGLGVPTVWLGCLQYLEQTGKQLDTVKRVLSGGSAVPLAMIKTFDEKYGVEFLQGWGMTEMSPLGTVGRAQAQAPDAGSRGASMPVRAQPGHSRLPRRLQGRRDSTARSRRMTASRAASFMCAGRGSSAAITRTRRRPRRRSTAEGWFKTGDVVVIDPEGYIQIVDRSKDVIKSGGEWISSIDVENAMMAHPDVAEAAVIGLPHPKWDERPLLIVVKKQGASPQTAELLISSPTSSPNGSCPTMSCSCPRFRMAAPARS